MTIQLDDTLSTISPQDLMRDIHQQLMSTHGLLAALSFSAEERREQLDAHGPAFTAPLEAGHAEAAAGYLAEEILLALRLSQRLLAVAQGDHDQTADTSDLSVVDKRRLACLISHNTALDVGEALGTLVGGAVGILRRLTGNIEHIAPLDPLVPALIIIGHRLETIDALTAAWSATHLVRPAKRRAA